MIKTSLMLQAQFSGPIPPPAILDQYNKILPGAAERIICMAEQQGDHRRHLEKVTIEANAFSEKLGPILGFIIAMTAIVGGIWLISKGLKIEGLAAVLTAIAAPVGLFVYGKYQQQKELQAKRDDPPAKKPKRRRRR
jgi:uncharacterized membrane protein